MGSLTERGRGIEPPFMLLIRRVVRLIVHARVLFHCIINVNEDSFRTIRTYSSLMILKIDDHKSE